MNSNSGKVHLECPMCGGTVVEYDQFGSSRCKNCGLRSDYKGRCGNCHYPLENDDAYCRQCGTKRGEGEFRPHRNVSAPLYGPCPTKNVHTCNCCGYMWTVISMLDREEFCPRCGNECTKEDVEEKWATEMLRQFLEVDE